MRKLRELDYKLLSELMKNAKRSDRQLAKVLKSSQPTITRSRALLERELIDGYTVIPKWEKLGYGIIAFTFVRSKAKYSKYKELEAVIRKVRGWLMKKPNVLFSASGQGLGWAGLTISVHKDYADFMKFRRMHDAELGDIVDDAETFIVGTDPVSTMKTLHLKYLAETK